MCKPNRLYRICTLPDFIAYYRVSTDRQGKSGLGLDAQRQAVTQFVGDPSRLGGEFTEIESGKRHDNRPQLAAALAECKRRKLTLVIAKLDRLARNVYFISGLMESKVDFVAVDMPQANKITIHILAAVAEHEREMISQRTRAALAQAKIRGTKLGNPHIEGARVKALEAIRALRPVAEIMGLMTNWRTQGWTYRAIANELNKLNIRPTRGAQWYASSVRNCLK